MFRVCHDTSVLYWHGTSVLVPTQGSPVFGTGSLVYGILFHRDSQTAPRGGVAGIERILCESKTATAGGSLLENVGHLTVRVSCVSSSTTSHDGSTPLASWTHSSFMHFARACWAGCVRFAWALPSLTSVSNT